MRVASFFALLSVLLLAACAAGPNYKRPATNVPAAYRGEKEPPDAKSLGDLPWWDLYKDPELSALIKTAVEQNLNLKIAVARVEEYRARARAAKADFAPSVSGTLSTSPLPRSRYEDIKTKESKWTEGGSNYTGGAELSWEIDFFGRVRRSSQAARADLLATDEARKAAMTSLVAQVANNWFQLRTLDEQRGITQETIKSEQVSLNLVRAQMRGGIASAVEEAQAVGQLAFVQAQLPDIERQIAQTENLLSVLLGKNPGDIVRSAGTGKASVPPEIPPGLPSELLERRPDISQAEQQLVAATARIGVAKASTFPFPSFLLTLFTGVITNTYIPAPVLKDVISGQHNSVFSWGPSITLPLLDLKGGANVKVAKAQAEQAALNYRNTILTALQEVADALASNEKVREQLVAEKTRVLAGREYLRLTNLRYSGGVADYLEVLDAERQLYSAEIDYSKAKLSQMQSVVQLYKALGGGWQTPDQTSPKLAPPAAGTTGPAPEKVTQFIPRP